MNPDEQKELLKEIRDILLEQNKLVDAQWEHQKEQWDSYYERWDAQIKAQKRTMTGCLSAIAALVVIFILLALKSLF